MTKTFVLGKDMFADWRTEVLSGTPPELYDVSVSGLDGIKIGPGLVALIGGAPGMGKTSLTMQLVVSAMLNKPGLTACIANVEMPPERLLERQLSRLSSVKLDDIQHRSLDKFQKRKVSDAFKVLHPVVEHLVFVQAPFNIKNVIDAANSIDAELIVLDYVQRIQPTDQYDDQRSSLNATMSSIRKFAEADRCVVALSAVGRSRDSRGRASYDGSNLSLASFRESSELEYGADDAYLLVQAQATQPTVDGAVVPVTLRHLKSRYGKPTDLQLTFDRNIQSFEPRIDEFEIPDGPLGSIASLFED